MSTFRDGLREGWLAGIIDGEGCIYILKNKRRTGRGFVLRPGIKIYNTQLEIIENVKKLLDCGYIYKGSKKTAKHKQGLVWETRRLLDIRKILDEIEPYLVGKQKVANIVLRFCQSRLSTLEQVKGISWKAEYTDEDVALYEQVKAINHKGPGSKVQ